MKIEEKLTLILIWLNNLAENQTSNPTTAKQYKIFTDVNVNESEWQQYLIKQFNAVNNLKCLFECQKNPNCNLVSFNKINNYCKLYGDYLTDETDLIDSKGNMIYKPPNHTLKGVVHIQTNMNSVYIRSLFQVSNKNLAVGLKNGSIIILSHFDLSFIRIMNSHTSAVNSMNTLKNGYLVSGSSDSTIIIWDHLTGTLINTLIGHTDVVWMVKVLSNNDIASGSEDQTVRIWDSSTGLIKLNFTQHTSSAQVLDLSELSNNRIVSLDLNGKIKIWNYLNVSGIISKTTGFQQRSLAILENDDYAIGAMNGSIRIYDSTTLNLKNSLTGHTDKVYILIKLENDDLCSGSDDKTIIVWDRNSKKLKLLLTGHDDLVRSIIQLHNGYLVSGGLDSKVIIWK